MTPAEALAVQLVARGAALLDEKRPGWEKEINLNRLLMYEPCLCILGQLYGMYYQGRDRLGIAMHGGGAFGFYVDFDSPPGLTYNLLTITWANLIIERRTQKVVRVVEEEQLVGA